MNVFSWWPVVSETLEQSNEKYWENNIDNTETPDMSFDWAGLYNTAVKKEETQQSALNENETKEKDKIVDENKHSPLIDLLYKQDIINDEERDILRIAIYENSDKDFLNIISNIEWIDTETLQLISDSLEYLNNDDTRERCIDSFNEDFNDEILKLKKPLEWWGSWEQELGTTDLKLINLIWSHYFVFKPNIGPEESKWEALDRAFKISVNELMEWRTFDRSEVFYDMLDIVNNPDFSFEMRYQDLKKIDTLIDLDQSRANWKLSKDFQVKQKWIEKTSNDLIEQFETLKKQFKIAQDSNNTNALEKLQIELETLKDEPESWDVFSPWEIDKIIEDIEASLKES